MSVLSAERRAFIAGRELHSAFAAVKDLSKRPLPRVRAAMSLWRLRINWSVAILGFPHGRVTPLIGTVIDWFTRVSHTKYADIMTGDPDR
jgi:hypothetical protein